MKSGLEGLEGAKSVKQLKFADHKGTYQILMDAKKSVTVEGLLDAVGIYGVDRVDLKITGDVEKTDNGIVFTARGSGAKCALKDRAKKDDEKEAPNVLGKVEELLKGGTKTLLIRGELKSVGKEKAQVLTLESAEAAKKE